MMTTGGMDGPLKQCRAMPEGSTGVWGTGEDAWEQGRARRVERDSGRMIGILMADQDDGRHAFQNIEG